MISAKPLTALALVGFGLSACTSGPQGALTPVNNPSVFSVHQPVVQRTDFVLDLDAAGDSLTASERARLAAWFESIEVGYGDQFYVEEARAYPSPGARGDVAAVLSQYGLLLRDGAPVTAGTVAPGVIRVIASRSTASVPGCPNWSDDEIAPSVNTSSNYGCSLNANIAAMVADPNDLVRGRTGSVNGGADTASRAVRVYRGRTPTGAQGLGDGGSTSGATSTPRN